MGLHQSPPKTIRSILSQNVSIGQKRIHKKNFFLMIGGSFEKKDLCRGYIIDFDKHKLHKVDY